jgi:hypothetical protein
LAGVSGQLLVLLPVPICIANSKSQPVGDVAAFATERWTLRYPAPVLPSRQPHNRPYANPILTKQFVASGIRVREKVRILSFLSRCVTRALTQKSPSLGLSVRLLPVLYKRAPLLHLLPVVSLRQELPFREPASIIQNPQAHIIVHRNNLVHRRSVWTTCWPPRRASTDLKTRPLTPFQARVTLGIWRLSHRSLRILTSKIDTTALSMIRMVPHEAFPILS